MHDDVSNVVVPENGPALQAYCEHVLHAEHSALLPKYPVLQAQMAVLAVLPAAHCVRYAELTAVQVLHREQVRPVL